ncbi:alanine dehydrogenase, partial [Bacillus atrophaeus]|nr:alanine dehydrogenase [Bacillus atrophaeus]
GAGPRTSTVALTNVTVPYALQIANKGAAAAIAENQALKAGLNTANGHVTYEAVARDLGYDYVSAEKALQDESSVAGA